MLGALFALLALAVLPTAARAADCKAGTLVTVVAHLDDDLLFVDPAISERLDAGWCITTVHLIGGANGARLPYVLTREQASRLAYARMAGVPDAWNESSVEIAGKLVHEMVLKAKPQVRLLELRLPGGGVRGGREPLGLRAPFLVERDARRTPREKLPDVRAERVSDEQQCRHVRWSRAVRSSR